MTIKKAIYVSVGCISAGLGALGALLPVLPTFPFLLLAAICFAKSSQRLHSWFIGTQLYKKNLESYMQGKGMTAKAKLRIIGFVSLAMGIGFFMMANVPVGRIILSLVWLCHVIYFLLGVRTISEKEAAETVQPQKSESLRCDPD